MQNGRATDKAQKLVDLLYRNKFVGTNITVSKSPPTFLSLAPDAQFTQSSSAVYTSVIVDLDKIEEAPVT